MRAKSMERKRIQASILTLIFCTCCILFLFFFLLLSTFLFFGCVVPKNFIETLICGFDKTCNLVFYFQQTWQPIFISAPVGLIIALRFLMV